jgi:chromosome partitioning protein
LPDELERPRAAGCDLAVIDTPPGRSAETPAAVEASDFVLIPIWLESDDFDRHKSQRHADHKEFPALAEEWRVRRPS